MKAANSRAIALGATLAATIVVTAAISTRAQTIVALLNEQVAANKAASASQDRINKLRDDTKDALSKYRQALTEADSYRRYNEQIAAQVESQKTELGNLNGLLSEIETTSREVLPLMQKMVEGLDQFVSLDVPFLLDERTKRVATLKSIMPRADVSISEKYRRILEAYQIEMEYGRTLDSYEGVLNDGGTAKTVEFVRLGRVSLMYRTLDGKEAGYWDMDKNGWVKDINYARDVREALRVAKKQGAPDMLFLPVPSPRKVTK
jgi:hypothetical protein